MIALRYRVITGIMLLACCTCNLPDKNLPNTDQTLVDWGTGKNAPVVLAKDSFRRNRGRQKDFLDSVLVKMDLSFSQIKQHTNMDSLYYKGNVRFVGDTVWFRNHRRPLAIVSYSDKFGSKKFLLVFNKRGECTATLMVGMNGDIDGGFDAVVLDYKIYTNYYFSTTETWVHREGRKTDKITKTEQFYWINKNGSIMAQNNIVRSYIRPRHPGKGADSLLSFK